MYLRLRRETYEPEREKQKTWREKENGKVSLFHFFICLVLMLLPSRAQPLKAWLKTRVRIISFYSFLFLVDVCEFLDCLLSFLFPHHYFPIPLRRILTVFLVPLNTNDAFYFSLCFIFFPFPPFLLSLPSFHLLQLLPFCFCFLFFPFHFLRSHSSYFSPPSISPFLSSHFHIFLQYLYSYFSLASISLFPPFILVFHCFYSLFFTSCFQSFYIINTNAFYPSFCSVSPSLTFPRPLLFPIPSPII